MFCKTIILLIEYIIMNYFLKKILQLCVCVFYSEASKDDWGRTEHRLS